MLIKLRYRGISSILIDQRTLKTWTVSLVVIREIDAIVGLEFGLHYTSTFSSEVISFKTSSWLCFKVSQVKRGYNSLVFYYKTINSP